MAVVRGYVMSHVDVVDEPLPTRQGISSGLVWRLSQVAGSGLACEGCIQESA